MAICQARKTPFHVALWHVGTIVLPDSHNTAVVPAPRLHLHLPSGQRWQIRGSVAQECGGGELQLHAAVEVQLAVTQWLLK